METGFPLVMLVGPALAAIIALLLRRFRRGQTAAGLVALALLTLLLALAAPGTGLLADNTVGFYGRELTLTPFVRALFLVIYPALAAVFAVAWFRPAGQALVPAGLAALAPLAAALMIDPPGLGAVLLVVAAAAVVPALHGGRHEPAGAAWRYFLFAAVAVAPALLAVSSPGTDASGWLYALAAALLLLGGFPFYSGAGGLGRTVSPVALALVVGVMPLVVVAFVLGLLDHAPAARAAVGFQSAVRWSAALTALVGVWHMAQSTDGRGQSATRPRPSANLRGLVTGAVLLDMAFVLLATLSPGADGLLLALPALISRCLSLLLIALGLERAADHHRPQPGSRWAALPAAAFAFGLLSLVGLPLTAGFGGRWALLAAGAPSGPWPAIVLAAAMFLGTLVALRALLRRPVVEQLVDGPPVSPPLGAGEVGLMLLLLGPAVLCGLWPNLLPALVSRMLGLG